MQQYLVFRVTNYLYGKVKYVIRRIAFRLIIALHLGQRCLNVGKVEFCVACSFDMV